MGKVSRTLLGVTILLLMLAQMGRAIPQPFPLLPAAVLAESTFDSDLDGWTGLATEVSWASTGGDPDGFLRWQDEGASSLPLAAPDKFLGDWSALDSLGFISFDQKVLSSGGYSDRGTSAISISGPNGSAYWLGPIAPAHCPGDEACDWTTSVAPLVSHGWTVTSGSWSALLADVTELLISIECYANTSGAEIAGLDNVRLGLAAPAQNIIDATYGLGAGSFELGTFVNSGGVPPTGFGWMGVAPGDSTTITGWTVGGPGDGVDWLTAHVFAPDTGRRAVDLQRTSNSSIATVIPTEAGRVYELSFSVASVSGYSDAGIVSAGSLVEQPFRAVFSDDPATQGYTPFKFVFAATGSTTTVEFKSIGPGTQYGPAIDSVSVTPVPDQIGEALRTSPSHQFSLQQNSQTQATVHLQNPGDVARSATLEIANPYTYPLVSLESQEFVTVDPGTIVAIPLRIDATSASVGVYDGILLQVAVDGGDTLYSNLTVYVTEPGAAAIPDLTVGAQDISVVRVEPGGQVTLVATVHNQGNVPATNVPVRFYDFGTPVGETVVPMVPAGGSADSAVTIPAPPSGDRFVEVDIDPNHTIRELSKDNNQASQVSRIESAPGPVEGTILVMGNLSCRVCADSLLTIRGRAVYDIVVDGMHIRDYPVKGGSVQVAAGWPSTYGDLHTDVDGDFSRSLRAPSSPGSFSISMTVSDSTFSGTAHFAILVEECPTPTVPQLPPIPYPDDTVPPGDWECDAETCIWLPFSGVPQPDFGDLWIYSEDILFSNSHPDPHQDISIAAQVHFFATRTDLQAQQVPVSLYAIDPGSGRTRITRQNIGAVGVVGSVVYGNWRAPDSGIYLIEAEVDPDYEEQNTSNNAATRAIIVGPYTSGQGLVSGQVIDGWGGVADVRITILGPGGMLGSAVTGATGLYLVESVPVGSYEVQIEVPPGYVADADVKGVEIVDQSMSTVDFWLTALDEIEDTTPPIITPSVSGSLGENGWYTSDVTVIWSVVDDESVVSVQTGCESAEVTSDTTGITFACSAASEGGTASESVTIRRDATPPIIIANISPPPNPEGWHNSVATVAFNCDDETSGVAACTAPQVLGEGADQAVSGKAVDHAGNLADTQILGINVDLTPPEVSVGGVVDGATYTLGEVPTAECTTSDALSGMQTDAFLGVTGGNENGVGSFSASCTEAMDRAGNVGAATVTYQIIYPFAGFFEPIDNPPVANVMRAGAAVPIKFSLAGNRGLTILAKGSPSSELMPCDGEDDHDVEGTVTAGNSGLSYDPTTDQYVYAWKTSKKYAGTCRKLMLTLDDGMTHEAYFKFE